MTDRTRPPARSSAVASLLATAGGALVVRWLAQDWLPGIVLGAAIGYLLAPVWHLRRVVGHLLEITSQPVESAGDVPASDDGAVPEAAEARELYAAGEIGQRTAAPPRRGSTRVALEHSEPSASSAASAGSRSFVKSSAPAPAEQLPSRLAKYTQSGMAWLKRGNPLARVGIVAMFFGAVFLAKYSAEAGFFPIEARFVALALGAVALVAIGWWLRHRQPASAQLLQGGGVADFYLAVFAALRLFVLLPPGLALGLMVAVAAAAAVLAVGQDALSLAFLATVGGFVAPLLVS